MELQIDVVPAHAGVIPIPINYLGSIISGPRTCGGDPVESFNIFEVREWSPHMRG